MDLLSLQKLARLIRYYILIMTHAAGSGHPTSCFSAVDLMTVLFFKYFQAYLSDFENLANDRFILSKGHSSALLYSLYAVAGKLTKADLLTYRTFESNLEGHPTKRFSFTEAATGSLGQGLSVGVGIALGIKQRLGNYSSSEDSSADGDESRSSTKNSSRLADARSNNKLPTVFVLLGDGEMAEGQNWEAIQLAAYYKLNNLVAILDVNRLGQSQQTMLGHDVHAYARRVAGFGWRTYVVEDGHDLDVVDKAFELAIAQGGTHPNPLFPKEREPVGNEMPAMIIAKTIKGKGVSFLEDRNGWHGKSLSEEEFEKAVEELGEVDKTVKGMIRKPEASHQSSVISHQIHNSSGSPSYFKRGSGGVTYKKGDFVATREAYGKALVALGKVYPDIVVFDGDVKNSTFAELFAKEFPERYFEMFIAEQNMVSVSLGLAGMGFVPFVSSFACFLTRAHDQIRMGALSGRHIIFCGSHAGVSIGEDGPSQMGLEDLALFRSVLHSTVLYPADAVATVKLVEQTYKQKGIVYLRTSRPKFLVIYGKDEEFVVGGSKVFSSQLTADSSQLVTIVAAGITVHEALKAQEQLKQKGIAVRVIDCYSIKPIDEKTLKKAARETKAIITVEDHYSVGGLGDAVLEALADTPVPVYKLAVTKTPRSGRPEELLRFEKIDAQAIVEKVRPIAK